jgi:hypothetical protein
VWAVGESFDQDQAPRTLVEHWDGSSWRVAPTPDAANGSLKGVAAVSASDVWAVGSAASGGQARPLALHWDGAAWKVTPGPAATGSLYAVAAASAKDVWAVGSGIQHWDGVAWKRVSAASSAAVLLGISVVSSRDIYAAGYSATDNSRVPHIEHWDGAAWKDVPISPAQNASRSSSLAGIASASATSLFAVGAVTGNDMLLTARTLVVQLTH